MMGIKRLKRKEISCYKPTDLWSQEDDLLFLKWATDKRDRCYHTMARDLSARPHEILNIKIKDIVFKTAGNKQYAEVLVNGNPVYSIYQRLVIKSPKQKQSQFSSFCKFGQELYG
ncbi:MAG TPA: hypothetical protein VFJ51_01190 [Nitrososphaeraceae archaeon]|nr:hypothetical protein [Nitrososphaeraceae archaeon]